MNTIISQEYEQILINTVRTLPPNRAEQLVDFARFLKSQSLTEAVMQGEDAAEVDADNARWDRLLATDESQDMLTKLAKEALAEHHAGKTRPMIFNDEGRIAPE